MHGSREVKVNMYNKSRHMAKYDFSHSAPAQDFMEVRFGFDICYYMWHDCATYEPAGHFELDKKMIFQNTLDPDS